MNTRGRFAGSSTPSNAGGRWVSIAFLLYALVMSALAVGCKSEDGGTNAATASASASSTSSTASPSSSAMPQSEGIKTGGLTPKKAGEKIRIGVTLHPYFSWARAVVKDQADFEIIPLLPGDVDAGDYQPRPEDIDKLKELDAVIVNGLGHDDFINDMLKAAGRDNMPRIKPNASTPTLKSADGKAINSHTFISFTNAVQQTYEIQKALAQVRPDLEATLRENASAYTAKLREVKTKATEKLAKLDKPRVVTVHDGYSYLCQELGIDVAGVVEPAHGLVPSAKELGEMVTLLKEQKVDVVLSEESFPEDLAEVLKKDGGARIFVVSHIASGEYTDEKFEVEMAENADVLVKALTPAP